MRQGTYHYALSQFFNFLSEHPVFGELLNVLQQTHPDLEVAAKRVFSSAVNQINMPTGKGFELESSESAHMAFCYFLLEELRDTNDPSSELKIIDLYIYHATDQHDKKDRFNSIFLEPIYLYLNEALEDQRIMLALLRRYKHKCEWFERDELFNLWQKQTVKGEKILAKHLYGFLYDQGINIHIEPSSASGEIDCLSDQIGDDRLAADAKIFNPEKGKSKSYIAKGFNQIYQYLLDFNEPTGYLVIFNTSPKDLAFALPSQSLSAPFLSLNYKTVYFITINIHPRITSASKAGRAKVVQITEKDLVQLID